MLAVAPSPRGLDAIPEDEATLSRQLSHLEIALNACVGRIPAAETPGCIRANARRNREIMRLRVATPRGVMMSDRFLASVGQIPERIVILCE